MKAIAQVSFVSKLVGSGFVEENRYRDFGRDSVVGRSYKGYMDVYYGVCSSCGRFFTFKSRTSVGVISDGSIKGVGLDDKAPLADGVGLTMPAHCGGSPT